LSGHGIDRGMYEVSHENCPILQALGHPTLARFSCLTPNLMTVTSSQGLEDEQENEANKLSMKRLLPSA
jgi:hypothetical protein